MAGRLSVMAEEALLVTQRFSSTWTSLVLEHAATAVSASSRHLITRWLLALYTRLLWCNVSFCPDLLPHVHIVSRSFCNINRSKRPHRPRSGGFCRATTEPSADPDPVRSSPSGACLSADEDMVKSHILTSIRLGLHRRVPLGGPFAQSYPRQCPSCARLCSES